jgi:hypothetical protein
LGAGALALAGELADRRMPPQQPAETRSASNADAQTVLSTVTTQKLFVLIGNSFDS